jgi:hypothetical protein
MLAYDFFSNFLLLLVEPGADELTGFFHKEKYIVLVFVFGLQLFGGSEVLILMLGTLHCTQMNLLAYSRTGCAPFFCIMT